MNLKELLKRIVFLIFCPIFFLFLVAFIVSDVETREPFNQNVCRGTWVGQQELERNKKFD